MFDSNFKKWMDAPLSLGGKFSFLSVGSSDRSLPLLGELRGKYGSVTSLSYYITEVVNDYLCIAQAFYCISYPCVSVCWCLLCHYLNCLSVLSAGGETEWGCRVVGVDVCGQQVQPMVQLSVKESPTALTTLTLTPTQLHALVQGNTRLSVCLSLYIHMYSLLFHDCFIRNMRQLYV